MRALLTRAYDFKGLATRNEFWRWWFGLGLASLLLNLPMLLVELGSPMFLARSFNLVVIANWAVEAPVIVAAFALIFRRLHDRGRSGFWALGVDALLLLASPLARGNVLVGWMLLALFMLGAMWLALELMLLPSAKPPNRYATTKAAAVEGAVRA